MQKGFRISYDLGSAPASWDFFAWLMFAEMRRISAKYSHLEVSFKPGPANGFRNDPLPGSLIAKQQLYKNVMLPLVPLVGGTVTTVAPEHKGHGYLMRPCIDAFKQGHKTRLLQPGEFCSNMIRHWCKNEPYITITLRESEIWPERNSNLKAWIEFAKSQRIRCVFIRDTLTALESLPDGLECMSAAAYNLDLRLALYSHAYLNMAVNNGPTSLLYYTHAPYLIFKSLIPTNPACTAQWWTEKVGIPPNTQYPWASNKQIITWADDDLDSIILAYKNWVAVSQKQLN